MVLKKALLVGINYTGTANELKGCINDVNNMKEVLKSNGYSEENITVLTDNTIAKPTRQNILTELLKLILSNAPVMFFHYSGHGSSLTDVNRDETDGNDESLVPIDYNINGLIIDDEIRGLLQCVNESCKLTAILDCCHSGTGLDLAWNMYEKAGKLYMLKDSANSTDTRGQVVMLSGCLDPQTSADSYENGQNQGALTYAFITTYKQNIRNYDSMIRSIRKLLSSKQYTQIPTLSSGRSLNMSGTFTL